ncbi:hypothetical protein PoB_006106800 [Plakobranchus ocellatus]|uniref:Uncharacterized protein n=1 Tax=Plakobranchus ocellatus TaxID=259542 RepID=A0AAV4CRU1_9GAST|nr:hypothetical protein PoB_006106800 [Plakobranchus ocellatus]
MPYDLCLCLHSSKVHQTLSMLLNNRAAENDHSLLKFVRDPEQLTLCGWMVLSTCLLADPNFVRRGDMTGPVSLVPLNQLLKSLDLQAASLIPSC